MSNPILERIAEIGFDDLIYDLRNGNYEQDEERDSELKDLFHELKLKMNREGGLPQQDIQLIIEFISTLFIFSDVSPWVYELVNTIVGDLLEGNTIY